MQFSMFVFWLVPPRGNRGLTVSPSVSVVGRFIWVVVQDLSLVGQNLWIVDWQVLYSEESFLLSSLHHSSESLLRLRLGVAHCKLLFCLSHLLTFANKSLKIRIYEYMLRWLVLLINQRPIRFFE
jgi:hypothetical protein